MRSYGPRFDPDGIVQHARVAQATSYARITTLWERKIAGGTIRCELYGGADGPARRIVQLIAEYPDGDGLNTVIRKCDSPAEETEACVYLEMIMRAATRRGASAEVEIPPPSAP